MAELKKLIVIGQAPGPTGEGKEPFCTSSYSGQRLRKYMGAKLMRRAQMVNLLSSYPGHSGDTLGGDRFDSRLGRISARILFEEGSLHGALVVMAGRHVAYACAPLFGSMSDPYFLRSRTENADGWLEHVCVPHPSGVNRWWNEPKNRSQARAFFKSLRREFL